jgi:hypothetical protein
MMAPGSAADLNATFTAEPAHPRHTGGAPPTTGKSVAVVDSVDVWTSVPANADAPKRTQIVVVGA